MKTKTLKTKELGTVVAMSTGLQLAIVDAEFAGKLDPDDAPEMNYKKIIPFAKENKKNMGVICSFEVHRGYGEVFRKGDELIVLETYLDEDSDKLAATKPKLNTKGSVQGTFTVISGAITLIAAEFIFTEEEDDDEHNEMLDTIDSVLKSGGAEECSVQDGEALIIAVENGTYEVILEKILPAEEDTQRLFIRKVGG